MKATAARAKTLVNAHAKGRPARALDGETPLNHTDTEVGAREVEHFIGRLEHGVYA